MARAVRIPVGLLGVGRRRVRLTSVKVKKGLYKIKPDVLPFLSQG